MPSTPLVSMHVVTRSTLPSSIFFTSALKSVTPNDRLLSRNAIRAVGYLSKLALIPSVQSADWATLYAMTPSRLLWSCWATHGSETSGQEPPMHSAPTSPKKLGGPAHSSWMFQPNVGMPDFARMSAPVNSTVATGSTANGWSWSTIASE